MRASKLALTLASAFSFGVAALHVFLAFAGRDWNRYFGAPPEVLTMCEHRPAAFACMTLSMALLFAVWAVYAAAAAGFCRQPPLLFAGLVTIGSIYLLRGLFVLPQLLSARGVRSEAAHEIVFSAASLCAGLLYLYGTTGVRRRRKAADKHAQALSR